jgi:hypothetical protein
MASESESVSASGLVSELESASGSASELESASEWVSGSALPGRAKPMDRH